LILTGSRKRIWALKNRCTGVFAAVLVLAILVPSIALFCWHWEEESLAPSGPVSRTVSLSLYPKAGWSADADWRDYVRPVANPVFSAFSGRDPFADRSEAMLVSEENPFADALAAGVSQGKLVVKGRVGGIPVFGPDFLRRTRYSDQDILRELQSSVGGSFGKFLKNTFGKREGETLAVENEADENPFRKAEPEPAKADTAAAETKSDKQVETSKNDKPATQDKPADVRPVKPTPPAALPDLLLRVGANGALEAIPADHPAEGIPTNVASSGTYQVSNEGPTEFNVFPFADPADFPMAMAVTDLNNDGIPDIVIHSSLSGMLHFFSGNPDGSYSEIMRVQAGTHPVSLIAGDFNRDGISDLAMSNVGTGAITVLFGSASASYNFRSFWADQYRDYISATDTTGTGIQDVVGLNFANRGSVLLDFRQPEGISSDRSFDYYPSLASTVTTGAGRTFRLNAVMMGSTLSLNVDSQTGQLTNVLSVAPGLPVSIVIGNLNNSGSLVLGIATPKKK
jgi:hypothetical protein